MKTFTAIAAATALLVSAGIASANSALPLNPNKSSQAGAGLAGLLGGTFAGGTIIAAAVVGSLVVLTIAGDDGTTTTTTVSTGSLF